MILENMPVLSQDIEDAHKVYEVVNMTATEIESLLKKPEYAAEKPDYSWITRKERREVNAVEAVVSFGNNIAGQFEDMIIDLGRIPSQQEFTEKSLEIMQGFWLDPRNVSETKGFGWTESIEHACKNRALRTYTSQLVEVHTITAMMELFPEWKVYCSDSLDLLMGVDMVVETDKKRIYVHIFKNSSSGFKAFHRKAKRGGAKGSDGKFKKYKRDFEGDKCLMFDYTPELSSQTTQFINGHPLFKLEFLEEQFLLFNMFSQIGEPLSSDTKLQYLNDFMTEIKGDL